METKTYAEVPLERLEHEISTLAAHIYAATCRWLLMIAEFDRREGWATWGMTSCAEWLAFKCSLSPRSARDHVRVAQAIEDLPHIRGAFAAGELSYSKVRALTRIATTDTDEDLAGMAQHCTAAQLDRLVRAYGRATVEEDLELAQKRHRDRFVAWSYDEYGMLRVEARLDPEEGMLVVRALEASIDAARQESGSAEPPAERSEAIHHEEEDTFVQRAADGLVMMAETYLEAGPRARKGGDRYQVLVHVDHDALVADAGSDVDEDAVPRNRRCHLDDGPSLAPETLRRLTCDSSIVTLVERNGEPLSVGRKTRSIPTAIRRALSVRDDRCVWPGCERKGFLDGHHIRHWTRGGETKLTNLVLMCRRHHRCVHEGGYSIAKEGDRFTIVRSDEIPIPQVAFMSAYGPSMEKRNSDAGVAVDHETCMTLSYEPLDHSDVVDALLSTERFRPNRN